MNVMIRNVKGEHLEYSYSVEGGGETIEAAVAYAVEQYINNKLGGFNTGVFPVTETLWNDVIKKAVSEVDDITIRHKIDILNSICRSSALKINKVFTGYTVDYPPHES